MNIEIREYTKIIRKKTILDNINLTLSGGKIYGLRGVNGSGKTMLIRAICGLIYPTKGFITINGKKLGEDISFPERVGALIESPALLPEYSAYNNLKLIASIKGTATNDEIINAIKNVGLDPFSKKKFGKFSLGMKQKLGIAAAIFESPDLVLLDEPFNALDEESIVNIKEIIRDMKCENRIIILSCHDRSLLDDISDETIEMKGGKIYENN